MVFRDLIPAQVRAGNLAQIAAQLGQYLVHAGYERHPGVYSEGVAEDIAEARRLLDFIEAAMTTEIITVAPAAKSEAA